MCGKVGFVHMIVPESRFRLTQGEGGLTEYVFNAGVAKHFFCKVCGVKSFYRPRGRIRTVGRSTPAVWTRQVTLNLTEFDGQNWEANAGHLSHLSRE